MCFCHSKRWIHNLPALVSIDRGWYTAVILRSAHSAIRLYVYSIIGRYLWKCILNDILLLIRMKERPAIFDGPLGILCLAIITSSVIAILHNISVGYYYCYYKLYILYSKNYPTLSPSDVCATIWPVIVIYDLRGAKRAVLEFVVVDCLHVFLPSQIWLCVSFRAGSNYTKSLQLQLHWSVNFNYNYNYTSMIYSITITPCSMFISITITVPLEIRVMIWVIFHKFA